MIDLSLTPAALAGEPWRLWSGHLVHWGAEHLALNVAAILPPLLLVGRRDAIRLTAALFAMAPLVSLAVLYAGVDVYRGSSGLVVGFWCAAGVLLARHGERVPSLILLALVAIKVGLEAAGVGIFPHDGYYAVPLAHHVGAVLGLVVGVFNAVAPPRWILAAVSSRGELAPRRGARA